MMRSDGVLIAYLELSVMDQLDEGVANPVRLVCGQEVIRVPARRSF